MGMALDLGFEGMLWLEADLEPSLGGSGSLTIRSYTSEATYYHTDCCEANMETESAWIAGILEGQITHPECDFGFGSGTIQHANF
jgi:hypothetical protein